MILNIEENVLEQKLQYFESLTKINPLLRRLSKKETEKQKGKKKERERKKKGKEGKERGRGRKLRKGKDGIGALTAKNN